MTTNSVVRELTDEEALQLSLIENLQCEDLNPVAHSKPQSLKTLFKETSNRLQMT